MGELSLDRYEIRRVLGKGGTGTVYEALDTRTHAVVALKTVEAAVAEDLYRLKHEFRVLSDVQHQNLVHFGELACERDTWFFTMELVPGVNFNDYVRPPLVTPAEPPLESSREVDDLDAVTRTLLRTLAVGTRDNAPERETPPRVRRGGPTYIESRLRSALAQLVEALSALHDAGHVHRDVKPSNVMVSHEGRVVLLDFGLVLALSGGEASSRDRMGTPSFMAPEQVEGLPVGAAADWYAVGTMLFVALTGSTPFADASNVMQAKLYREAPAPRELVRTVPPDLDRLCVELLARDPARRPTEDEIRARLRLPPRPPRPVPAPSADAGGPFVGRGRELAVLGGLLHDVDGGHARAAVVEGEPGVGKTALVSRFLARAPERPLVLSGRCYEQESVPFKGVDSVIDALSEHLLTRSDADLATLLAGGVRYLATVFPVLRRVDAIHAQVTGARAVVSQGGLREHAFGECARLLRALAEERPVVIFLDDLQWIDGDSLALLERSVLPQSGTPCLFLATLRTGMELPPAVARIRDAAERIAVRGLSDDESRALWDALRPGDDSDGSDVRDAATREAGGHPLFLAELARAADAGRWSGGGGALLDVLRDRIARHDATERAFLEMAAVAGAPTPYEVVARAAGLDVGDCQGRLGALKANQLLRVTAVGDDRCVEPYHDRIREALIEPLAANRPRRLALERALGESLLAAAPPDQLRARVYAIVQHLNAARELLSNDQCLRLAELDLVASREARLATAYDRARAYARIGAELLGTDGWERAYELTRDLHRARMEADYLAGDRDGARRVFDATRPRLVSATDVAALWASWIVLETGRGRFVDAIAAGRAALRELGLPIPEPMTRQTVLRQYARTRWAQRGRTPAALEALPEMTDPRLRGALRILMSIGPVAYFVDNNLLAYVNLRIAELSMRHGLSEVAPFGFGGYGMVLAGMFGVRDEAAAFGDMAIRLDRRLGGPEVAAKLYLQNGAFLRHRVRPFGEAKDLLRTAHRLGVEHGDASYEVYAATILSVVTYCESAELAGVETTGSWAREVAARRRIVDMATTPDIHARHAAALQGHTPDWRELGDARLGEAALRASLGEATPVSICYYHICSAELAYLDGDIERAAMHIAAAEARTRGFFALPTNAELCFLGGLITARRLDDVRGRERVRLVVDLVRRCRRLDAWARGCAHNYRPQAAIARAELLRVLGRTRLADRAYQRAVAAARRSGNAKREALALELAALHAARCGDAELAALRRHAAIGAYRRWGASAKADQLAGGLP